MTLATVTGYDVTSANYLHRPATGQPAFYVTGTPDIAATPAMMAAYPGAITINQSGSDLMTVADFYDVETGALTPAEVPGEIANARQARLHGNGRRNPGVYVNQSNITAVANALSSAKLVNVPLWVANYNLTLDEAISLLQTSSGPYPIVGYQYANAGLWDDDVWLTSWVTATSQIGTQTDWRHCSKCKGLFYGPSQSTSACPKGGNHDGSNSYTYTLPYSANLTS